MKLTILVLILVALTVPHLAQDNNSPKLIPFEVNEKWGYINDKGKVVIKPQFDEADTFSEGLAVVEKDSKSGFINYSGEFVIEPKFGCAYEFTEGLAPVAEDCDGLWGYIDHEGNTVIEPKFAIASNFSEGLADVLVGIPPDVEAGFIDKTGNLVIEPQFGWVEPFSDGLAIIAHWQPETTLHPLYNRKAFIDKSGNRITPFFENADGFREGLAGVKIGDLWGFINTTGTIVIPPAFYLVGDGFKKGFAAVECEKGRYGFIDKTGKKLIDCTFIDAEDFSEGLAAVQNEDKKWGFVDTNGRLAIKPKFYEADAFYNELAKVRIVKGKWIYEGFINHKGKYVVKPVKKETVYENQYAG